MTGGAEASVIWQTTGKCPSVVKVETPIGKTLYLDIIPKEFGVCGVVKDAGDDPDVTTGAWIYAKVTYCGNDRKDFRSQADFQSRENLQSLEDSPYAGSQSRD